MIRAALISIVFLGVTLALILMQPSTERPSDTAMIEPAEAEVSRAQTELDGLEALSEEIAPVMQAEEPQPVTPQPEVETAAVPVEAAPALVEPSQPEILPEPANDLEKLIVNALKQGQSEAYIDALVNEAASQGAVEVPQSLVTEDGRVDTGSLLAVLSSPTRSASVDTGTIGARSYVVEPGDSLASISYRFYGSTSKSVDIFVANRSVLKSPNHVEVGQMLVIPAQ